MRLSENVQPTASARSESSSTAMESPRQNRWSNRAIGLTVLGVMAGMACLTMGFALWTVKFRRENDSKNKANATLAVVPAVPPSELSGLAYLPANVQLIGGVHFAQALDLPAGKVIAKSLNLTGLASDEIDNVAFGADLNIVPPRLNVVVRTRRPVDLPKLQKAWKAERSQERNGKPTFTVKLPVISMEGAMMLADERTLLWALSTETLDVAPKEFTGGLERFAPNMRSLIADLPPDSPAWVVTRPGQARTSLAALLALAKVPKPLTEALQKLQSAAVFVEGKNSGSDFEIAASVNGLDEKLGQSFAQEFTPSQGKLRTEGIDPFRLRWTMSIAELEKFMNRP